MRKTDPDRGWNHSIGSDGIENWERESPPVKKVSLCSLFIQEVSCSAQP